MSNGNDGSDYGDWLAYAQIASKKIRELQTHVQMLEDELKALRDEISLLQRI